MEDIMVARQRYTVRTVYACNDCDMETLNETEMLMHVSQQIIGDGLANEAVACKQLGEDVISTGISQKSHTLVDQETVDELVMKDLVTCNICEKRFKYKSCFEYHARKHHTGTVAVTGQTLPTVSVEKNNLLEAVVEPCINDAEPYSMQPTFEKSCPLNADDYTVRDSSKLSSCSKEPSLHSSIVPADDMVQFVQDKLNDYGNSNIGDTPATRGIVEKTGPFCNKCDKHFSTVRGLNIHMSKHKKDGHTEFQNTKDELAHHCMICSQQFNTAEEIVSHVKSVHCDVTAIPCEHCSTSFSSPEAYDEHVKANPSYLCGKCCSRLSDVKSTGICCVCNMEQLLVSGTKGYNVEMEQTATTGDEMPATAETGCRSVIIFGQASPPPEQRQPFVCSVCSRKFAWRSNLRRHMRMHAPKLTGADCTNKNDKCDGECHACGRAFDSLNNTHQQDHLSDESRNPSNAKAKRFSCTTCGQQFVWSHNLRRHMRRTHADPFFIAAAEEAKKTYSTYSNAKLNGDVVDDKTLVNVDSMEPTDGGKCVCKTCGHHFFWESNLRRHIQQVHHSRPDDEIGSKTGSHTCAKCGRRFKQMYHLRVHLRAHFKADCGGTVKPHLCSTCGRNFSDARQLRVHQLRHSGIKPHQCSKCGKAFTVLTLLNEHVAMKHEGRRLVCEQCGHEANSRSALHTHIRYVHAAPGTVRPYVCSTCSRGFWSSAALKRHEMVHTEAGNSKRKAMCSICQMLFRHVYNLEHHINSSHQTYAHSAPFACSTCREQFSCGAAFKAHYRSKHRNR